MESTNQMHCLEMRLKGQVQGVGMRPSLFRLADSLGLSGTLSNSAQGTELKLFGSREKLSQFTDQYQDHIPTSAKVEDSQYSLSQTEQRERELRFQECEIREENINYSLPTDRGTCPECWNDFFDPSNRRYQYPFITCCECGPRWTLIKKLPFERNNTSMIDFPLCQDCQSEYDTPEDRRFFAQTISCSQCGPKTNLSFDDVQKRLSKGQVGLVKGIGGFAIVGDARSEDVIRRIRKIKQRPDRPLAVMVKDQSAFEKLNVKEMSYKKLQTFECPIQVCEIDQTELPLSLIAPGLSSLGVMAPTSPFHYLLFGDLDYLIFSSGNLKGEPIEYDLNSVDPELLDLCDFFLDHNREIAQPVDDSVVSVLGSLIRVARGHAPRTYSIENKKNISAMAWGADMKSSLALIHQNQIFHTPYIGTLGSPRSVDRLMETKRKMEDLFECQCQENVADLHPSYLSTYVAEESGEASKVQHHYAHAQASLFESPFEKAICFVADGTGHGLDGKIWGGEVFHLSEESSQHVARFENYGINPGEESFQTPEKIFNAFQEETSLVKTNSIGRWFDLMAWHCFPKELKSLSYEAQAPIFLENHVEEVDFSWPTFDFLEEQLLILPLRELSDLIFKVELRPEQKAWLVHDGLAEIISQSLKQLSHNDPVIFSGGVFHNSILHQCLLRRLEGVRETYFSKDCGDHQIALGQILARLREDRNA
jgi:hydrogenase maturation protein HypF